MNSKRQASAAPTYVLAGIVAAGLLAAGTVAACDAGSGYSSYVGMCVDQVTQQRVPDDECGLYANGAAVAPGYVMDYVDLSLYPSFRVPAYGSRFSATNVTIVHNVRNNTTVYRNVSRTGGVASSLTTRATVTHTGASPGATGASNQGTVNSSIQRGGFGVPSASRTTAGGARTSSGS